MYDLFYDYIRTDVFYSTDTTLDALMDAMAHLLTIALLVLFVVVVFAFIKRLIFRSVGVFYD